MPQRVYFLSTAQSGLPQNRLLTLFIRDDTSLSDDDRQGPRLVVTHFLQQFTHFGTAVIFVHALRRLWNNTNARDKQTITCEERALVNYVLDLTLPNKCHVGGQTGR